MKRTFNNAKVPQRTPLKLQNDRCPFPGCGLAAEHDGEHVPLYRLVQRFLTTHGLSGDCEYCDFNHPAVALYATADGRGMAVCLACEDTLVKNRLAVAA